MKIGIVGSGKLSQALVETLPSLDSDLQTQQVSDFSSVDIDLCIHAGSGREWNEALEMCSKKSTPLIQASTPKGQDFPKDISFVGVYAPNLCVSVLKFLRLSHLAKALYPNAKMTLIESHQKEKTTRPATVERLADLVGVAIDKVQHIRDPSAQVKLGISEDMLKHHAYHELKIEGVGAELKLSCKVGGATAYAEGAYSLIQYLKQNQLKPGIYYLEDLIEDAAFEAQAPSMNSASC